jgi:hypothetical protein
MVCVAGDWAPGATVKLTGCDGFTTNSGVAETYSVIGISSGLLMAAAPVAGTVAAIEILPVQVPAGSPAGFIDITRDPSVVPLNAAPAVPFS